MPSLSHFCTLDLETTGLDVAVHRPVQSYLAVWSVLNLERPVAEMELIFRRDAEEVGETSHIHRITPALSDRGLPPTAALGMMGVFLRTMRSRFQDMPLVVFNAAYDMSMLIAESPVSRLSVELQRFPVIDPMVIDRQLDRYRKGKRRQTDLARLYTTLPDEILDNAHDAAVDCRILANVAVGVLEEFRLIDEDPWSLHNRQIAWAEQQKTSYARWKGIDLSAEQGWPVRRDIAALAK